MTATVTIIGKTKGSPDDTQNTLAHFYQQDLGTGARMAQGDGTATGLILWANAIGVENASGFKAKIETAATADRTYTLPDAAGTVVLGDGTGVTDKDAFRAAISNERQALLASDFTTTEDTAQSVTGFLLSLEADAIYQLSAVLRVSSSVAASAVRPSLTGPAASLSYLTAITRRGNEDLRFDAFDQVASFANSEGVDLPEIMTIEGVIAINSTTPASDPGLAIQTETNGHTARLLAGSVLTLKKLN